MEKYEEALKIYRKLVRENPNQFEFEYAKLLIMGFLLKGDKNNLKEAKKILKKYENIPLSNKLLEMIKKLENK